MCKRVQKQAKSKHVLPNARHTAMGGRVAQLTEVSHGQHFKGPVATHNRCWLANCGLAKGPSSIVRGSEIGKMLRDCSAKARPPPFASKGHRRPAGLAEAVFKDNLRRTQLAWKYR